MTSFSHSFSFMGGRGGKGSHSLSVPHPSRSSVIVRPFTRSAKCFFSLESPRFG